MTFPSGSQGDSPTIDPEAYDWEETRNSVTRELRWRWDTTPLADIEDAVQDAIIKVLQHARLQPGVKNARAYTKLIAHNLLKNWRVRRLSFPTENPEDVPESDLATDHRKAEADREMVSVILEAVQSLSPELREAFMLHVVQGMTTVEIAQSLNIGQACAKMRCVRAQGKVRSYVNSHK